MGHRRQKPDRLGEKLTAVRNRLDLSMASMAEALSDEKASVTRHDIFEFEKNERDPSLIILLRYSKLARVRMEIFADDSKDLPW